MMGCEDGTSRAIWCVELDFLSLECNEVSSNEL